MKPHLPGIQNVARLLSVSNPRMPKLRLHEVIENEPVRRLENGIVYRKLLTSGEG